MVTREIVLELMEKEATRPLSESELAEMLALKNWSRSRQCLRKWRRRAS